MDDTSRVSREAQARFSEGLGVKLPGATRPTTEGDIGKCSATYRDQSALLSHGIVKAIPMQMPAPPLTDGRALAFDRCLVPYSAESATENSPEQTPKA